MCISGFWVLLIYLSWFFSFQPHKALSSQNHACNSNDLIALKGFFNGLDSGFTGWQSTNTTNDSSDDCCTLVGVSCKFSPIFGNRVTRLNLANRRLKGEVSESLAALDQLQSLNLSSNSLRGVLPPNLFRLPNLRVLDLSDNKFYGAIDALSICGSSNNIQVINLSLNYFSGKFPVGFGNCTSLQHLSLNSNYLSGNLPEDVYKLGKLSKLYLQENKLHGFLDHRLGNLSSLVELDLSFNGFMGNVPDVFSNIIKLERLSAHSNQLTGCLPTSLSNCSMLHTLSLRNNSFNCKIQLNCSATVQLAILDLGSNQFHGPIPGNFADCKRLKSLNLARSNIDGQVPESLKDLHALTHLSLSNNSLHNISAALGVLRQCRNLTTLVLTMNFYGEQMPNSIETSGFKSLKVLIMPACGFSGIVPAWLGSCIKLQMLDLSFNHLFGTIPFLFKELDSLIYLDLSNNLLSGEVPESLAYLKSFIHPNLTSLEDPASLLPFPLRIGRLSYNKVGSFRSSLCLGANRFVGPIPREFGNLKFLQVLNLSGNNLSGSIPDELSGLKNLEILDLSFNSISGSIPSSLTSLTFLSQFSVAHNHLAGRVPSRGQFQTFPCSSFQGNLALDAAVVCSPPSPLPPVSNNKPERAMPSPSPSNDQPKKRRTKIVGLPFGIGVATGFVISVTACFLSGRFFQTTKKKRSRTQYRHSRVMLRR